MSSGHEPDIPAKQLLMKKHGDDGPAGQKWSERKVLIPAQDFQCNQRHPDDGSKDGAEQHREQHRLPAEERADHGEQFNITASHALFSEEIRTDPGQHKEDSASQQ